MSNSITRIHIRGRMGVQILQAATALSRLDPKEDPVICVNTQGLSDDFNSKLHLLFDPQCRVVNIDDSKKTPYWVSGAATSIFENRDKIFRWMKPKVMNLTNHNSQAIHIRGGDKKIVSAKNNDMLVHIALRRGQEPSIIYTNDRAAVDTKHHDLISNLPDAESDWWSMYHTKTVYAAPSAFIMSMLLVNPDKHIIFMNEKQCDGEYPHTGNDFLFLREAMAYCKNVEFLP